MRLVAVRLVVVRQQLRRRLWPVYQRFFVAVGLRTALPTRPSPQLTLARSSSRLRHNKGLEHGLNWLVDRQFLAARSRAQRLIGDRRWVALGCGTGYLVWTRILGMEYSSWPAILVSQSTDKVTRCGPGFLRIHSGIPWKVCAVTVSRDYSAGSPAGLAPGWCG